MRGTWTTFIALIALTGCGGGDDTSDADEPAATAVAGSEDVVDAADADEADAAAPSAGQGMATLTLDNGETFEFAVLCALEPQIAAGSEILFTATSRDFPGLDITQFGDEGPVTGVSTVQVWDANYDTLWDAGSFYAPFGGAIELAIDGSTITGSGSFFPEGDIEQEPVDGEVVANC